MHKTQVSIVRFRDVGEVARKSCALERLSMSLHSKNLGRKFVFLRTFVHVPDGLRYCSPTSA